MKKILIALSALVLSSCTNGALDRNQVFAELRAANKTQNVYEVLLVVDSGKKYQTQTCRTMQNPLYMATSCDEEAVLTTEQNIAKDLEASGFFKVVLPQAQYIPTYRIDVSLFERAVGLKNIFNSPKAIFTIYKNNTKIKAYEYKYSIYAESNRIAAARMDYMHLSDVMTAFIRDSIKDKIYSNP